MALQLVYLVFLQRCGSIVACRGEVMMQSCCFTWWADHRVMVSVGSHLGILGIFFFSCVGTKAPLAAEMPWGELGILGILP